jgi:hypothetical protein
VESGYVAPVRGSRYAVSMLRACFGGKVPLPRSCTGRKRLVVCVCVWIVCMCVCARARVLWCHVPSSDALILFCLLLLSTGICAAYRAVGSLFLASSPSR